MKFNSQICTTREQSERLLALGLKKETADMYWVNHLDLWMPVMLLYEDRPLDNNDIPAWSLHRLIEMADTAYLGDGGRDDDNELWMCLDRCYCWNNHESFYNINLYGSLIDCIEWLIKEGRFNKEYLV